MENFITTLEQDIVIQKIRTITDKYQTFFVGGVVRDLFLYRKVACDKDIIVCDVSAKELALELTQKLNAHFVELDSENNIYRVVLDDKVNYIDIVNPIDNDLEKDIFRRDFTINAILYDMQQKKIVDIVDGIDDLKSKKIRMISTQNMIDDPLRLLRAFRFQATLGFELTQDLQILLNENPKLIEAPAKERILAELIKLFEGENAHNALFSCDDVGMLKFLIPQIEDFKKIPPNAHHHLNLFKHSIETVKQLQLLLNVLSPRVKQYFYNDNKLTCSTLGFLKLSAFLHDIGKPQVFSIDPENNRHRFIKHDLVGAEIVIPLLKNLKLSKKQISYVSTMIKNHIYPSALVGAYCTEKAKMRFFRKLDNLVPDVILLAQADRLSARGEEITEKIVNDNINALNQLMNEYFDLLDNKKLQPIPKLLNGNEISEILGIPKDKNLGLIIEKLQEEQIIGNINTKEDAIIFLKSLI